MKYRNWIYWIICLFASRLLFHLLNHLICGADDFSRLSERLCNQIYQESVFIIENTRTAPEFKDLFMEQTFLCAFSGFGDFVNNEWISKVLSWQLQSGCFSYDNITCSSHMNGLGAATLALYGRMLEENEEIWMFFNLTRIFICLKNLATFKNGPRT